MCIKCLSSSRKKENVGLWNRSLDLQYWKSKCWIVGYMGIAGNSFAFAISLSCV
jgi:hypothetical protein